MSSDTDLLQLTAELVDLPSPSFAEGPVVDHLQRELEAVPSLQVDRVGDNLVARTSLGRDTRLILAGHTDTVLPNGNETARLDGDTLWGVGSTDMKGGLAVMLELGRTVTEPVVDVTYVFYAREEVARVHSGLNELFEQRPDLLEGDVALLGEPTSAAIEAGCQGTLRYVIGLAGRRAHPARAWMGVNAIHRLSRLLAVLELYEPLPSGHRRVRVPRGAPGHRRRRWGRRQRGARLGAPHDQPSVRARSGSRGGRGPCDGGLRRAVRSRGHHRAGR